MYDKLSFLCNLVFHNPLKYHSTYSYSLNIHRKCLCFQNPQNHGVSGTVKNKKLILLCSILLLQLLRQHMAIAAAATIIELKSKSRGSGCCIPICRISLWLYILAESNYSILLRKMLHYT